LALAAFGLAACAGPTCGGQISGVVVDPDGAPLPRAWVMTCSGRIVPTGADGSFVIADLSNGGYALKAVFPGMADALLARLAVTSDVPVTCRLQMTPSDAAVVSGHVTDAMTGKSLAAWFEARSGSKPVRWFDAAGRPYGGRSDVPPEVWHQPNRRFWTSGTFAFSADPGKLHLTVRADGYAPATVERVLQAGRQETLEVTLQPLFDPAAAGWYKGDFHAHGVHGERLYDVNIPMIAFMLRAEHYRWFYLSSAFDNDGVRVDAAFDLGRTPGTMGATFIRPVGGRLSRESIVEAFKSGRTTISWNGALLLFTVDGADCGTAFPSGEAERNAVVTLHDTPGKKRIITVTRNGEAFKRIPVTVPACGVTEVRFDFSEREKAWYSAACAEDGQSGKVVAASSPFYFGDWSTPPPVLARVTVKVFDAETRTPLDAEISLCDMRQTDRVFRTQEGTVRVEARVFHRLRAHVAGYEDAESGVLGVPSIRAFIDALSEEDLQAWETYEQAKRLLQTAELPLVLKRK